ncbi:MAG: hypothetical protein GX555_01425 [Actinomycetales bacterium]|nr:hypothetical protein [Actinomycetales bacterium]
MTSQLDYLAAQSIAAERERDLTRTLRHRTAVALPPPARPATAGRHWLQDTLVHLHLRHAPTH